MAELAKNLGGLGFEVLTVVPAVKDQFANGKEIPVGSRQAAYLDFEWIRRVRLNRTPTVMIFDQNRRLIWAHEGVLKPSDNLNAMQAVHGQLQN